MDVLEPRVVGGVLCKVDGTFDCRNRVRIPNSSIKSFLQMMSLSASTTATYSASVVHSATDFYSLDCHDTAPPAYFMTYPDVDRLVSTSTDMYESVKPSNRGLLEPNPRQQLVGPFRYWCIHLTIAKCSLHVLLMNQLTTLTANPMSGRVHTLRTSGF